MSVDLSDMRFQQIQGSPQTPTNPFFHRVNSSKWQLLKKVLITPALLLKIVPMVFLLILAWFLSLIGTLGLKEKEVELRPFSRWRKVCRWFVARVCTRGIFFFAGFFWVKVKGKRATRSEAPILVVAPHSSPADVLPFILMGAPSVVVRSAFAENWIVGPLVRLTQPICVSRESKLSRIVAIENICNRALSDEDWSQIYIYPEGTTTNRSALVDFLPGAFYPGVPVQPVVIKYPNWNDTITWTWDGLTMMEFLYNSLAQFYLSCEVEFLEVYHPNTEEDDERLFAKNVRNLMADHMNIPVSDFKVNDGIIMTKMIKKDNLVKKIRSLKSLRNTLKISLIAEFNVAKNTQMLESENNQDKWIKFPLQLQNELKVVGEEHESQFKELCELFFIPDHYYPALDFRHYMIYTLILETNIPGKKLSKFMFLVYNEKNQITKNIFLKIMKEVFGMNENDSEEQFYPGLAAKSQRSLAMGEEEFEGKVSKPLDYLRLYAQYEKKVFTFYPPRDFEF